MKNMYTSTIAKIFGMNPCLRAKLFIKAIAVVLLMGLLFISNITMAAVDGTAMWTQLMFSGPWSLVVGLTILAIGFIGFMRYGLAVGGGIVVTEILFFLILTAVVLLQKT